MHKKRIEAGKRNPCKTSKEQYLKKRKIFKMHMKTELYVAQNI